MPALPLAVVAFVAGALLGGLLNGPVGWTMALTAATVLTVTLGTRTRVQWLVLLAAVALAGAGHLRTNAAVSTTHVLDAAEGTHDIVGVVSEAPDVRGSTVHLDLRLEELDGKPAAGSLIALVPATRELRAGDRIRLTGSVEHTDLSREAIVAFPDRWEVVGHERPSRFAAALQAVRARSIDHIERVLPEPESSLAVGILVGVQRSMPEDLEADLRATGTTHLVVVSGQNVALVIGLAVASMSALIARRRAAVLALLLLPAYVALVGADPPVVRAAIMAVGVTLVDVLGRRTPGWIFLAYSAAAMLAVDPSLANDLSFQLSFAATAGVVVVAPPLRDALLARLRMSSSGAVPSMIEVGAISTGAALAVAPVQVAAFGTFALMQVPVNILVAPLYEATLLVAAAAAFIGGIPALAPLARLLLEPVPEVFVATIHALAGPRTVVEVPAIDGAFVVGWYALLATAAWLLGRTRPVVLAPPARSGFALTLLLACTTATLWYSVLRPEDDTASVTVLDVGQGLAILVRDGDRAVLIDAGPPDGAVMAALGRLDQFEALDAIILTHPDLDHAGGLEAITRRIGAASVLTSGGLERTPGAKHIDIGDRVRLTDRTAIDVLSPPTRAAAALSSDNDRSLVLRISVGDRRILLPADIEADAERWLVHSGLDLRSDALVIPHHGSTTSSTPAFVEAVHPAVAIASVGASNPHGHPAPIVLERYANAVLLRTDVGGDITIRSDGRRLWYSAARR